MMAEGGNRGTTKDSLACCLCARLFPGPSLMAHMDACRRQREDEYRQLPPPYDASDVLRPKTLLARNLLPRLPSRGADRATLEHFNKRALELFEAQCLACDGCGRRFPPDDCPGFRAHLDKCQGWRDQRFADEPPPPSRRQGRSSPPRREGPVSIEAHQPQPRDLLPWEEQEREPPRRRRSPPSPRRGGGGDSYALGGRGANARAELSNAEQKLELERKNCADLERRVGRLEDELARCEQARLDASQRAASLVEQLHSAEEKQRLDAQWADQRVVNAEHAAKTAAQVQEAAALQAQNAKPK